MTLPRILVIDDELGRSAEARLEFCESLALWSDELMGTNGETDAIAEVVFCSGQRESKNRVSNDLDGVLRAVRSGWPFDDGSRWSLILLDMSFTSGQVVSGSSLPRGESGDDIFGSVILRELVAAWPGENGRSTCVPTILHSSQSRKDAEQLCNRLGALDFIERGLAPLEKRQALSNILHFHGLVEDGWLKTVNSTGAVVAVERTEKIVGRSEILLEALRTARRVSDDPSSKPFIRGEKGTGKELLARYIHDINSPTSTYIACDLNAIPPGLFESTIFGATAGSYTSSSKKNTVGLIEKAADGTLFIDEIGNLPKSTAQKLLRVIENGTYSLVGSSDEKTASCRFIFATNKNVEQLCEEGNFPSDLLDRLTYPHIWLPPLRERGEDIRRLFDTFLEAHVSRKEGTWPKIIESDVYAYLSSHDWPDNIRGLHSLTKWLATMRSRSTTISRHDLLNGTGQTAPFSISPREPAQTRIGEPEDSQGNILGLIIPSTRAEFDATSHSLRVSIAKLIVAAADVSRNRDGQLNKTGVVNGILGSAWSTTKARRQMKKLDQVFRISDLGFDDPGLNEVLAWANDNSGKK